MMRSESNHVNREARSRPAREMKRMPTVPILGLDSLINKSFLVFFLFFFRPTPIAILSNALRVFCPESAEKGVYDD
jgi:hypothetical protein